MKLLSDIKIANDLLLPDSWDFPFDLPKYANKKYKVVGLSLEKLRLLRLIQVFGTFFPLLVLGAELFFNDSIAQNNLGVRDWLLYILFECTMFFVLVPYVTLKIYQILGVMPKVIERKLP